MTRYTFTITEASGGRDHAACEYEGQTFEAVSRHGATMALARQLVAAGARDAAVDVLDATTGKFRFSSRSLHALAKWTITEDDRHGLRMQRHVPRAEWQEKRLGDAPDGVSAAAGSSGHPEASPASTRALSTFSESP